MLHKFKMSEQEAMVALGYWDDVYRCGSPTEESDQPTKRPKGHSIVMDDEWDKLFHLRSIADEDSISEQTLKRIFLATG